MNLSEHFTLEEFIASQIATRKGIDNTPSVENVENVRQLCLKVLEPLREKLGKPIHISSGYRSTLLNEAVGGSENSEHIAIHNCAAADTEVFSMTAEEWFHFIINSGVAFDQLILEFGKWCHISWSKNLRGIILIATKNDDGKAVYTTYHG